MGPELRKVPKVKLSVGIIVTPRFTLSALGNFVDVLRLSSDEGDRSERRNCDWRMVSDTMSPVRSSCGLNVQPDQRLGDPRRFDYIAVVGGLIERSAEVGPAYQGFLREAAQRAVPLIGICTGSFLLYKLGLLDGYRCCVSWFHHNDFLENCGGPEPVSNRMFVVDRDRLTCPGGNSSAYLAAWLVERHVSETAAKKSLRMLNIPDLKGPEEVQPGVPLKMATNEPTTRKALLFMHQNLDAALTIDRVSRHVGLSRRQLERKFIDDLGMTPSKALRQMRLDQAEALLLTTGKSLANIALESGFSDDSHLVRLFRHYRGVTPNTFRSAAISNPTQEIYAGS
ncbi:GlxA family transcriptional regulator [Mesorhizobium sp. NZP2077]|uniref:GlxA family transcriptional regulator n=1 Tax=Mesorhizobium sp. NZP2077 TaxID=2483404 RepID=UPI0015530D12|nr:GlxA family transcriptional regulator [Mesorhizobium sp. NZP2077]QKC86900.1 GlxA family transcriptional regulator [Mesorhizobium sp. NZP2077]QKD20599.1 GlxA family transcriptional regulator [Mesorhizobium sp. NZP2077]